MNIQSPSLPDHVEPIAGTVGRGPTATVEAEDLILAAFGQLAAIVTCRGHVPSRTAFLRRWLEEVEVCVEDAHRFAFRSAGPLVADAIGLTDEAAEAPSTLLADAVAQLRAAEKGNRRLARELAEARTQLSEASAKRVENECDALDALAEVHDVLDAAGIEAGDIVQDRVRSLVDRLQAASARAREGEHKAASWEASFKRAESAILDLQRQRNELGEFRTTVTLAAIPFAVTALGASHVAAVIEDMRTQAKDATENHRHSLLERDRLGRELAELKSAKNDCAQEANEARANQLAAEKRCAEAERALVDERTAVHRERRTILNMCGATQPSGVPGHADVVRAVERVDGNANQRISEVRSAARAEASFERDAILRICGVTPCGRHTREDVERAVTALHAKLDAAEDRAKAAEAPKSRTPAAQWKRDPHGGDWWLATYEGFYLEIERLNDVWNVRVRCGDDDLGVLVYAQRVTKRGAQFAAEAGARRQRRVEDRRMVERRAGK